MVSNIFLKNVMWKQFEYLGTLWHTYLKFILQQNISIVMNIYIYFANNAGNND